MFSISTVLRYLFLTSTSICNFRLLLDTGPPNSILSVEVINVRPHILKIKHRQRRFTWKQKSFSEVVTKIFYQRKELFAVFGNLHDLKASKVFFQLLFCVIFDWNKMFGIISKKVTFCLFKFFLKPLLRNSIAWGTLKVYVLITSTNTNRMSLREFLF